MVYYAGYPYAGLPYYGGYGGAYPYGGCALPYAGIPYAGGCATPYGLPYYGLYRPFY